MREGVVDVQPFPPQPLVVDPARRRLYVNDGGPSLVLGEYDLDRPYGKMLLRTKKIATKTASFSYYYTAPDLDNRRAFLLDNEANGKGSCPYCSFVRILDLEKLSLSESSWNLSQLEPNFFAEGITYSAADRRLYAVGSVMGYPTFFMSALSGPVYPVSVIAIDVDSGALAWSRTLTKCMRPMSTYGQGAGIFRSAHESFLYVPCGRADANSIVGVQYPGRSGIDRLKIDSHGNSQSAMTEELFAGTGGFTSIQGTQGRTAFDYVTDRVFVVSNSAFTPGTWVFDGRLSAWVGFIPAANGRDMGLGLDPATGHVYNADGSGMLLVTDGRATPVPQGTDFNVSDGKPKSEPYPIMTYVSDPVTHRVFVATYPTDGSGDQQLVALRDNTPSVEASDIDLDALTSNVAEGPDTNTVFAGDVSGFGAHLRVVGGLGGATSSARPGLAGYYYSQAVGQTPGAEPGDRGAWLARVPSVDVRNIGAGADAQPIALDDLTSNDRGGVQQQIAQTDPTASSAQHPDQETPAQQAAVALDWPWPVAHCLDAEGSASSGAVSQPVGEAQTHCDLESERASASVHAAALAVGDISIASSGFEGSSQRTSQTGIATTATAFVRGLDISLAGYGRLRIATVEQTVTTTAHGRPGTTHVTWEPLIGGVVLSDKNGKTLFTCDVCDQKAVVANVNDLLGIQLRMTLPSPERIHTPKGAFAGFQEEYSQYINDLIMNNDQSRDMPLVQFEILNDSADKSRVLLQLAAVSSSSMYGISSLGESVATDLKSELVTPVFVPPDSSNGIPVEESRLPVLSIPTSPVQRLLHSALFFVRSPTSAMSFAALWLLFFGPVVVRLRRGTLADLARRAQD